MFTRVGGGGEGVRGGKGGEGGGGEGGRGGGSIWLVMVPALIISSSTGNLSWSFHEKLLLSIMVILRKALPFDHGLFTKNCSFRSWFFEKTALFHHGLNIMS